jgi:hypothetical protein
VIEFFSIAVIGLVAGFVSGILVGHRNVKLVSAALGDVKSAAVSDVALIRAEAATLSNRVGVVEAKVMALATPLLAKL